MNLYRLNLNLLPGLKALLDTQSVSLAAQQMHVTQSAMSRTLAQLREALNDPILVRQGNRIFLSQKAIAIKEDVNRVVTEASTIFDNQHFDPATTDKHFTIAASDYILDQRMPEILKSIWQQAPQLSVELLAFTAELSRRIDSGEVDLVLGYTGAAPNGFGVDNITCNRACAVLPLDHPLAQQVLTVEHLEAHGVITHAPWMGASNLIDDYLTGVDQPVKIAARVPNLPLALQLLKGTEHILLTTQSCVSGLCLSSETVVKPLPNNPQEVESYAIWPEYWQHNRAHRWFREFIVNRVKARL